MKIIRTMKTEPLQTDSAAESVSVARLAALAVPVMASSQASSQASSEAIEAAPIAVIWHRFGPYHLARLAACATQFPVVGIEMSGADLTYAWRTEAGAVPFRRLTVFPDMDCSSLDNRMVAKQVQAVLDQLRPAAVAIPSWGAPYSLGALAWCLRTGTPSIVMVDSNPQDKPRNSLKEWLKRRIVSCFGAGLVCKPDYLATLGMPPEAIRIGYNVVDNRYFSEGAAALRGTAAELRRARNLPRPFLLVVARFIPKKNLATLLEGFNLFTRTAKGSELDLVLLGDGPLRPDLEQQVARLGLASRVHFPGFAQYDELPAWYAMASALVLPSTVEQWGLVVNEAMAAGLPVLVSHHCGCAEVLVEDGRNGWRFDPAEPAGIARCLSRFAALPDGGAAFGARSRELIAAWTPLRFAHELAQAAAIAAQRSRLPQWLNRLLLKFLIPRLQDRE